MGNIMPSSESVVPHKYPVKNLDIFLHIKLKTEKQKQRKQSDFVQGHLMSQ